MGIMKWRYILIPLALLTAWVVMRPQQGFDRVTFAARCSLTVENRLKAPATAKFPNLMGMIVVTDDVGRISAWVDSQNSFGALIRTNFLCTGTPENVSVTLY